MHSSSVTHWLCLLKDGDQEAAQHLWERYFQRLVKLAYSKLKHASRRPADEEDVALSAFASFCERARAGQFPQLHDRNDLWRVLVIITARKASNLVRNENRQKRGGRAPGQPAAEELPADPQAFLEHVVGPEPTPEFAAQVAEEYELLLAALGDSDVRRVAVLKMEGHTVEDIAELLGCVPRTIERKLRLIRSILGDLRGQDDE